MAQPCKKIMYRIPGPSTVVKESVEWMRPLACGEISCECWYCFHSSSVSSRKACGGGIATRGREVTEACASKYGLKFGVVVLMWR